MYRFVSSKINILKSPQHIIDALTNEEKLKEWWGVSEAFIQRKDNGLYTLAWLKTQEGTKFITTGRISLINPRSHLHLEDILYLSPNNPIQGPFKIYYDIVHEDGVSTLTIKQDGFTKDDINGWYYKAVEDGWPQALYLLKTYLED